MKKKWLAAVWAGILLMGGAVASQAAGFTFETIPAGGAITGSPGETVGWGYAIGNPDPTNWLMVTDFSRDLFSGGLLPDASWFDYPILAPNGNATGKLLEVAIDSNPALAGLVNSGIFTLSAVWFDGDPLGPGTFIADAQDRTAPYRLTVLPGPVTSVPEPGTLLLLASGLAGLAGTRKRFF